MVLGRVVFSLHVFFSRYVREIIAGVISSNVGCNIGGKFINILVYADDMVLLAPSWIALQKLIDILSELAAEVDMTCNILDCMRDL